MQSFSAYPSHPPPLPVRLTLSPDHDCSYFPDRLARTRAFWAPSLPDGVYHQFMDAGFRRSGRVIYQPICAGCRACVPIRVPVQTFIPSKSQRRVWRRNRDVTVTVDVPNATAEKHALYNKYRRQWHDSDEEHDWDAFVSFLYDSPVSTLEFIYRDSTGGLLGIGICDVSASSMSSVYFYFDPCFACRAIGTFSVLWELEWARQSRIPYLYLGYWIAGCRTMQYKADFRPCEILGTDGIWLFNK